MTYDCLIIDDEKLLADSTAEYFNLFGVKTALAYSASDCRNFFKENTAELLLLDINLGDGSGFELCKELRETTEIPILAPLTISDCPVSSKNEKPNFSAEVPPHPARNTNTVAITMTEILFFCSFFHLLSEFVFVAL